MNGENAENSGGDCRECQYTVRFAQTRHRPSREYTARAAQMIRNAVIRAPPNGSSKNHIAQQNCKVGAMYCNKPTRDKGMRRSPAANNIKGNAVIGPDAASNNWVVGGAFRYVFVPCAAV